MPVHDGGHQCDQPAHHEVDPGDGEQHECSSNTGLKGRAPRFTLNEGETWELPQSHYTSEGAELGGGIIPKDAFVVEVEDRTRACGCECGRSVTGR